jgi:hypothetical protein
MASWESTAPLLALPDACLVKVLQCCAADEQRSLFSAARSHSRLHQAAVTALRSLTACVAHQKQVDDVLLYLGKPGRNIDSFSLSGREGRVYGVRLCQLPAGMQLSSLQLNEFHLQLQPGNGCQGVLGAAAAAASLTQLVLWHCLLLDSGDATEVLAASLAHLPAGLEHLSIDSIKDINSIDSYNSEDRLVQFPTCTLQRLQCLTHLQLAGIRVKGPADASPALQPLKALTRLQELQIKLVGDVYRVISPSMLAGAHHLTRLQLNDCEIQTGVLEGHTQLQHLDLHRCKSPDGAAGVAQLLAHLEPLQQLTNLGLVGTLSDSGNSTPPAAAAAYAALTASSKLRELDLRSCRLPLGAWQHVFKAGRQLQHLHSLNLANVQQTGGYYSPAPDGSLLVSCCPRLRSLDMQYLELSSAEVLGPLQGLSGLHTLRLALVGGTYAQGLPSVGQLTALKELTIAIPIGSLDGTQELIMSRLTLLQELTKLDVGSRYTGESVNLTCEVGC